MISLKLLSLIGSIFDYIFSLLPSNLQSLLTINLADYFNFQSAINVIDRFIDFAFYFIPFNIFTLLLTVTFAFALFYVLFAIVHLILSIT